MLFQYVGDPVTNPARAGRHTGRRRAQLRADLGLDQPFSGRSSRASCGNAVQGEFGLSLRQGRKVSSADRRAPSRDAGTCRWSPRRRGWLVGIPMGVLRRAAARTLHLAGAADAVAAGRVAADLPDRHPADPGVRGNLCGWLPELRSRRRRTPWAGGPPACLHACDGWKHIDPAGDHAGAVPDDARSCGWCAPRCSRCCAPTTSSSRAPAA